jgi:hypothetical protein
LPVQGGNRWIGKCNADELLMYASNNGF